MLPTPCQASSSCARESTARPHRPSRPEDDPFNLAPVDVGTLAPGAIIRSREVELAFMGVVPQKLSAWQLLYRSTDLNGNPEAAITTVLLPEGADPTQPRPLLAYQCAIDAISSKCFPSYAFRRGARSWGAVPPFEFMVIAGILRRGWAVSIADHEGLDGRFGAAREPGYRVLDGLRAALAFEPIGLDASTPIGIMGYSGGGMASSWAVEMAAEYAPELNIVGAALGAPVGDPGQTFIRLNGGPYAGLPAMVVAGLRGGYPGLATVIDRHATGDGLRKLQQLQAITTVSALIKYRNNDFDDYLDTPLADVLATPEVRHVFEDLRLGHRAPACPLLVVQGRHDRMIHVDDVDAQVARYVDGGAAVQYIRDRASGHISLQPLATPLMLRWLSDTFAGRPVPAGTNTVRSVAFSRRSLRGYLAMVAAAMRTWFARPHRQATACDVAFGDSRPSAPRSVIQPLKQARGA